MKFMWKVIIKSPKKDQENVTLYGIAANANIAMSKAKKKVKEILNMKSDGTDLMVLETIMLHEVEF
ncbi:hypothetical protein KAR91_08010 [Candidatus Pacearchaeota archaeon]|nr:hypothetical protein [Candidatus Pacearchaeota archaeon]